MVVVRGGLLSSVNLGRWLIGLMGLASIIVRCRACKSKQPWIKNARDCKAQNLHKLNVHFAEAATFGLWLTTSVARGPGP